MTTYVCAVCKRVVSPRYPAKGLVQPYRHLPPEELGKQKKVLDHGWFGFGHGRWCAGSFEPALEKTDAAT